MELDFPTNSIGLDEKIKMIIGLLIQIEFKIYICHLQKLKALLFNLINNIVVLLNILE